MITKKDQKCKKDNKRKCNVLNNDSDEDSLTQFMTPEVRQQILNKRKRNKEMLDKLKSQITHFDGTTKEVEGTGTACATNNGNVSRNNTKTNKKIESACYNKQQ